jgi:DNA topoisomerase-1
MGDEDITSSPEKKKRMTKAELNEFRVLDDPPLRTTRSSTRNTPAKVKNFKESSSSSSSSGGSDNEEEEDNDEEVKTKPKRKVQAKRRSKKKTSTPLVKKNTSSPHKISIEKRTPKVMSRMKQLENAMKSYKWWEAETLPEGTRWKSLEHNGVQFPPVYIMHNVPLLYSGERIILTSEAEELATYYAACLGSQQLEKESTAKTFNANFFSQFKLVAPKKVELFIKCDFSLIRTYLDTERDKRKEQTKEQKEIKKQKEEAQKLQYAFALVDGTLMKVANSLIEPPGLFRGVSFFFIVFLFSNFKNSVENIQKQDY